MIVVADTGPLNYLVLIGGVHVLPSLFSEVMVLETVAAELTASLAAAAVRQWMRKPPAWPHVRPDPPPDGTLRRLDPGESSAIALAISLGAGYLLMDDRNGCKEAERFSRPAQSILDCFRNARS